MINRSIYWLKKKQNNLLTISLIQNFVSFISLMLNIAYAVVF